MNQPPEPTRDAPATARTVDATPAAPIPRPYAPPTLIVYGRVGDLTRTVGSRGRKDARRGRRRTGF